MQVSKLYLFIISRAGNRVFCVICRIGYNTMFERLFLLICDSLTAVPCCLTFSLPHKQTCKKCSEKDSGWLVSMPGIAGGVITPPGMCSEEFSLCLHFDSHLKDVCVVCAMLYIHLKFSGSCITATQRNIGHSCFTLLSRGNGRSFLPCTCSTNDERCQFSG